MKQINTNETKRETVHDNQIIVANVRQEEFK